MSHADANANPELSVSVSGNAVPAPANYDDSVALLNFFTRFLQNDIGRGYHSQVIAGVAREGVVWLPVLASPERQFVRTERYDSWHDVALNLGEALL